jgi:hypothetical protein
MTRNATIVRLYQDGEWPRKFAMNAWLKLIAGVALIGQSSPRAGHDARPRLPRGIGKPSEAKRQQGQGIAVF